MTEEQWLSCNDPTVMLEFLRGKVSGRKLRLFNLACCRRIWHLLSDERSRMAVEVSERDADERVSRKDFDYAYAEAQAALSAAQQKALRLAGGRRGGAAREIRAETPLGVAIRAYYAAETVTRAAYRDFVGLEASLSARGTMQPGEHKQQCILLRDIFNNPFNPLRPVSPVGGDCTVRHLAEAIYQERRMPEGTLDAGRLAILADALLDAGCNDEELIAHCRSEGPHVRGCFAVDLILGKE
jgi:hypothetical protein